MGVFWQRGRRGKRSSAALLGSMLNARFGMIEGVLTAVAIFLVLWILWPEEEGAKLSQSAAVEQNLEESERRRALVEILESKKSKFGRYGSIEATSDADAGVETEAEDDGQDLAEIEERPRIAKPSELADRDDGTRRLPGLFGLIKTYLPGAKRPVDERDVAEATIPERDDNAVEPVEEVEVAALSSEAVDALSSQPGDLGPGESEVAALTPSQDAAVKPFIVERDPSVPTTGVEERPRDFAPTWLRHAVASAVSDERPIIAIVIDDLGLNRPNTAKLNKLPAPLTLAFLPYAGRIEAQTEAANEAGHELMLHMPMEPLGADWPGPDALTTQIDQDEFITRLIKNLDRFEGFVGINNHMGSRLTADRPRMDAVMQELRKRDVLFLDSRTNARSVAVDVAGENGVPNTTRDIFLDHVIDFQSIKRQLARTERVARQTGSAVAIGHPHGATIEALREWLPRLEERGFKLAPISAVVARRACNSGVLIAADTCGRYLQARSPAPSPRVARDG